MRECPDCAKGLVPIRVLPAGLAWTRPEARPSLWDGRMPTEGEIRAAMCPACGRVLFHADLPRGPLPIPAAEADPPAPSDLPLPADGGDARSDLKGCP